MANPSHDKDNAELKLIEAAVMDVVLSREGKRRYSNGDSLTLDPSDLRDIVRLTMAKCATPPSPSTVPEREYDPMTPLEAAALVGELERHRALAYRHAKENTVLGKQPEIAKKTAETRMDTGFEDAGEITARPAELDDEGLPPLPESKFCAWLLHGQVVNAFPHGVGDKARWDHDGHWAAKGYDRAPLFTAEQYRQGQRDAVAADRARRGAVDEPFYPQLFLNWNRSQENPPVSIGKEMGVARKAVELSRSAPSHTTNKEK